ncbi:MAG: DUF1385 domain-containing protein [Fimbriimonadaceae bacterium]
MTDPLIQPAGLLARPIEELRPEDSLHRAAHIIRSTVGHVAPVMGGGRYIGVVSETSLEQALAESVEPTQPVLDAVVSHPTIAASATGAEVLRVLRSSAVDQLVVLSEDQVPIGLISASDLFPRQINRPVPAIIGGMATPFGVYLTNGSVTGGVSRWALVGTGAVMSLLFMIALIVGDSLILLLPETPLVLAVGPWLPIPLFCLFFKLIPLTGIHAAEHQVVHALERNERLVPEVVRRMPRVHPRCGTNIAVGFSIFYTLYNWQWVPEDNVRFLLSLLVTAVVFRPVGGLVQLLVTTKKPTEKQIASGIKAGNDLLENYAKNRRTSASPLERILNMGILQVMLGSSAVAIAAHYIAEWCHFPISL